ncbi:MAG: DUF502 domain-containing protein [Hyphomonadaceae bacterium]|nr:DUF502 domain-containing protein [Hyphomonadaceae bacterium]
MQDKSRPSGGEPVQAPDFKPEIGGPGIGGEEAGLKAELAKLTLDETPEEMHLGARLRNYFVTGLVVVGPVGITLYIAWNFITMVDAWVKPYVPRIYNPDYYLPFPVPGVGLLFAMVLITIIGALAGKLLGRSLISAGELMLGRTPIVRNVYRGLKQIFESVVTASSPSQSFQKVALMEFPSKGIWSIVFVTGEAAREISKELPGRDLISVFMPTGMLPPSGFVCFVPRKDVLPIRMTFEDAAKIIISAGMVNPETQARLKDMATRVRNGQRATLQAPPASPPT